MSMPWQGATHEIEATKWWTDIVVAAEGHYWLDSLGGYQPADLEGWWDGAVIQPAVVLGYWDGGTIAPFAPAP